MLLCANTVHGRSATGPSSRSQVTVRIPADWTSWRPAEECPLTVGRSAINLALVRGENRLGPHGSEIGQSQFPFVAYRPNKLGFIWEV